MKRMKQAGVMAVVLLSGAVGSGVVQGGDWHWLGVGTDWSPRLTLDGQGGTNSYGIVDAMVPLLGSKNGLLFLDGRGLVQIRGVQNSSVGLGYRGLVNHEKLLLGGYGFYDRPRTSWGNFYHQVNAGGEIFGGCWEGRVNGYLPVGVTSNEKILGGQGHFEDHQLILNFDVGREQLLPGVSVEVGRQLGSPKLKGYGEYYYYGFSNGATGINGGRVRAEYEVNRYVTLTASDQYDSYNKNQVLVGMRINLGGVRGETKGLRDRMEDWIQRDSFMREEQAEAPLVVVHNQKYYFVKAGAEGGDGRYQHPYGTVSEAVEAAGAGDHVIYAYGGNYSLGSGLSLYEGQQVYGANVGYYLHGIEVLPKGEVDTVLQGSVELANNTSLNNLTVDGSVAAASFSNLSSPLTPVIGISGNNLVNVMLNNVTVQNFSGIAGTPGASGGGAGTDGGDAYGIQLLNGKNITLNNVTVQNIAGGQGGTGGDNTSGAGGNAGNAGNATGIDLSGSSYLNIANLAITQVAGGSSLGGSASAADFTSGSGSFGGNAIGLNVVNVSNGSISSLTLNAVTAGSSLGGTAQTAGAFGGFGSTGGYAIGVDLSNSGSITLDSAAISNITGGNSVGGDAIGNGATGVSNHGGSSGLAGNATGVEAYNSASVVLSNSVIKVITAGFSKAGDNTGFISYTGASGASGGAGGNAIGIDMSNSISVASLNNILSGLTAGYSQGGLSASGSTNYGLTGGNAGAAGSVLGINATNSISGKVVNNLFKGLSGGYSQGGNSGAASNYYSTGGRGGLGGNATAIEANSSAAITLTNNTIDTIIGGSSFGGNVQSGTKYPTGGAAGTAGNAIGIDATAATNLMSSKNIFNNLVAGTAPGGTGNPNGADGTPGIAVDQQGP